MTNIENDPNSEQPPDPTQSGAQPNLPHWSEQQTTEQQTTEQQAAPVGAGSEEVVPITSDQDYGSYSPPPLPPNNRLGETVTPILTGIIGAGVFLVCYSLGKIALLVLITAALAVATLEFYATLRKVGYHPATLVGLASTMGLSLGVYWRGVEAYPALLGIIVFFTFLWFLFVAQDRSAVPNIGATLLGVFYIGGLGSMASLLLNYEDGENLVLAAVLAAVSYDVGGWIIGRTIGRTQFTKISPNKTLEGLMGGMISAILIPVAVLQLLDLAPWGDDPGTLSDVLLLGIVAAVVAPLGDLNESLLKRSLSVKDMGSLLPGHGGVLDRIDALLFVLPASYVLARLLDIVQLS